MSARQTLLVLVALLGFGFRSVGAAPGDLDPSFSTDGILHTGFGFTDNQNNAVALQGDGKVVVGGEAYLGGAKVFTLHRYNVDGSLDLSFGHDGIVMTSFGSQPAEIRGLAVQGDGKIVAAGTAEKSFAVARYLTDGSLDATWDGDGKALFSIPGAELNAYAMILQGAKVLVAGEYINSVHNFAVARFSSNGSHDTSFDGDGIAITDLLVDARAMAIRIQPDGKILAVGDADGHIAMARYLDNGGLDATLDSDGKKVDTRPSFGFDVAFTNNIETPRLSKMFVAGEDEGTDNFAIFCFSMDVGSPGTELEFAL